MCLLLLRREGRTVHKVRAFAWRSGLEMLRDPLSYLFCLGFPLVMLAVMTLVDATIPTQANMTIFHIDNLCGGIAVFGQMFVMLFTAITVAKDRSGAFLLRMYATPMAAADFAAGYMLPMLLVAMAQGVLIMLASVLVGMITGVSLSAVGLALGLLTLVPSAVLFIAFGLLIGSLFNDKAAPGLCSIIISLGSFLGSIWFDAESAGGVLLNVCRVLPFHYCTKAVRAAMHGQAVLQSMGVVAMFAVLVSAVAAQAFKMKMKAELA